MRGKQSPARILMWYGGLGVFGVLVTCAVFAVFVSGPDRGTSFYIAASIVCLAVLVFFTHLAHSRLASAGISTATPPIRIQVQFLILFWLVLAIAAAILAADPDRADTSFADRVFVIYLVLTFLFFAAAYFLYSKDLQPEDIDREVAMERRDIQFNVPDVKSVMRAVDGMGEQHPEQAQLADRVHKKLDTVRSALDGVIISATNGYTEGHDLNAEIAEQIIELVSLSSLSSHDADPGPVLDKIGFQADLILRTLEHANVL